MKIVSEINLSDCISCIRNERRMLIHGTCKNLDRLYKNSFSIKIMTENECGCAMDIFCLIGARLYNLFKLFNNVCDNVQSTEL